MSRAKRLTGTPRSVAEKHRLGRRRFLPNKKHVYIIGSHIDMVPTPKQSKSYHIYICMYCIYTWHGNFGCIYIYTIYQVIVHSGSHWKIPATWVIKPRHLPFTQKSNPLKKVTFCKQQNCTQIRITDLSPQGFFSIKLATRLTRGKKKTCVFKQELYTLPETNRHSIWKLANSQKETIVFRTIHLQVLLLLVSGRVNKNQPFKNLA